MSDKAKNTPQGPVKEVIGGGLAAGVINQLKARENLISTKSKSKDHLLFFNGNGSWARLVSSINTITEKEATDLAKGEKTINEVVGNKNLAYNNILMGGTLKQSTPSKPTSIGGGISESTHSPIKLDSNGYIQNRTSEEDSTVVKNSAYHKYSNLGFRPTPGIESVSVTSKGTYGTLREAEVNITVWDLDDLEVIQALYLRPGYTVLLEWGHSIQLNNDGDGNPNGLNTNITTYKKFLRDNLKDPMLTFEKDLLKITQDSYYNYDAFVGYVSNFNWSLREDGGYNCQIKIIAKGSVLESIKATFDPSFTYPADQMTRLKEDKGKEERKSIFHKLFTEMQYWVDGEARPGVGNKSDIISGKDVTGGNENISRIGTGFQDEWFGSDEVLLSNIDSAVGAEAQINASNQELQTKLDKLKNGDSFTYKGYYEDKKDKVFTFTSASATSKESFAFLEEEEVVYYLQKNFSKYGLTFREGTIDETTGEGDDSVGILGDIYDGITLAVTDDLADNIFVDVDNNIDGDNYRQTLRIIQFITYKARIEDNSLTDKQREDRANRAALAEQEEIDATDNANEAIKNDAQKTGYETDNDVVPVYTNKNFERPNSKHFRENLNNFAAFRLKGLELKDSGFFDNDNLNEFWIPLYVVLDVYNNYISLVDQTKISSKGTNTPGRKLTQFYTGYQDVEALGAYDKELKYLTSNNHFSINPMICVLPKKPKLTTLNDSKGNPLPWPDDIGEAYPAGVIWKNNFHTLVEGAFKQGLIRGAEDDILNILIPCQLIKDKLDKIVQQSEDSDQNQNNNIVTFLRDLFNDMNHALGGVNDFDLFYDDRDDLFYIIDRKVTPALRNLIPTLSLSGTKSVMSNVQIDSQISGNIANMISIAAQGSSGNATDNVSPMLKWNAGLLDRHIRHKSQDNDDSTSKVDSIEERENPEDKRKKKWMEDYKDFWHEFNGEDSWDDGDFNASIVDALNNFHKKYCQTYVVEAYSKDPNDKKPPPGVIPVELSFDTIGLGGLKIGQAFQIEQGLLPKKYAEDFGYIITGLSHNIADNKWITSVKTQFYIVKPPTDQEVKAFQNKNKVTNSEYKEPVSGGGGNPGPVVVPDIDDANALAGEVLDYDKMKSAVIKSGHKWDEREYAINIVGVRNYSNLINGKLPVTNKYIDLVTVSWIENGLKKSESFPATTVPGKKWTVDQLINSKGAGFVQEGQYPRVYKIGTHKKYTAFQQRGDFLVWRDKNMDYFFDMVVSDGPGKFAMNLHRSKPGGTSTRVAGFSAGCQVVATDGHLTRILQLARQHTTKLNEERYTYTLIKSTTLDSA